MRNIEFTVFKCKFKLNFYFLAFITFMLVTDSKGIIIYGFISALMHELGHLFCMNLFGCKVRSINFGCLNTEIVSGKFEDRKSLLILFGGCLVNFLIAFAFIFLFLYFKNELFKIISLQNMGLGMFNLLPISNLDGGQILYILLKSRFNEYVSLKILNTISFIFILPLFILGFYVLINSKYNFSLFLLSLYLISYILFKEDIF